MAKNLPNRTITVSVPYGTQGETLVTFYNRIKRGFIKVCKVVPTGSLDALGTTDFTFNVTVGTGQPFDPGADQERRVRDHPVDYPILQPNGHADGRAGAGETRSRASS